MRKTSASAGILAALAFSLAWTPVAAVSSKNALNLANPATQTTNTLAVTYSPDVRTAAAGIVTVNNGTQTADNRSFCVVFKLANPGLQGGLSFTVVDKGTGNILSLSGSPTSTSQMLTGSFAAGTKAGTNQVFDIEFGLAPSPMALPGTYTATITETLYGGSTMPTGSVLDTNTLSVTITVGSFYDVSVVPTGSAFAVASTSQALSFGELVAGAAVGADILVRSNVSYSLALASANLGSLANPQDATSLVGYSLSSNGSAVSLDPGPGRVAAGAAAALSAPTRYAIRITIPAFQSYPSAGTYTDTITVTLSSP